MKSTNTLVFFVIIAVGVSALAIFISFCAFSVNHLRSSSRARDLRSEVLNVSEELPKGSHVRSMDERRRNIEEMLTRLENGQVA